MNTISEIERRPSPAPMPQSLCWNGESLWMGSMETKTVYQLDPTTLSVLWEVKAPGTPFGITYIENELRVLCGETEEDNRIIRRLIPGHGFDTVFNIPCPEDTGSQLGFDGSNLHVSQWYNKRVLALEEEGQVLKSYTSPHGIAGQVIVEDSIYLLTTDDESTDEYFLTRIDTKTGTAEDVASVPFQGRSLAHNGKHFLSNHRSKNEIVSFTI